MRTLRQDVHLCIALAPLMPRAADAAVAWVEWQVARKAWLQLIEQLGLTEAEIREASRRACLAARLAMAEPEGSA